MRHNYPVSMLPASKLPAAGERHVPLLWLDGATTRFRQSARDQSENYRPAKWQTVRSAAPAPRNITR